MGGSSGSAGHVHATLAPTPMVPVGVSLPRTPAPTPYIPVSHPPIWGPGVNDDDAPVGWGGTPAPSTKARGSG